jgi:predicted metal-dependent hydrolase
MSDAQRYALHLTNGQTHEVEWRTSSRSRHIRVTVTPKGIRVSSPPRIKWELVEKFLREQEGWLSKQVEKLQPATTDELLYLGKAFSLEVVSPTVQKERVRFEGKKCLVAPVHNTPESVKSSLDRWLRTQAAELLTPVFVEMRQEMRIDADRLSWKETSSRWGSCAATGAIMLNWRLIHAPLEVSRYVIIHELAHRKHMDHSSRFWNLVEKYDPAYKLHRGWLKRNGHRCRVYA